MKKWIGLLFLIGTHTIHTAKIKKKRHEGTIRDKDILKKRKQNFALTNSRFLSFEGEFIVNKLNNKRYLSVSSMFSNKTLREKPIKDIPCSYCFDILPNIQTYKKHQEEVHQARSHARLLMKCRRKRLRKLGIKG